MTTAAETPKWLDDILDQINPPADTILTDPTNTAKVLSNLNMSGCRFEHADGEVRMGLYVPCADPDTKEGVGLAVIFMGDDTRMYRRAKSIQGVDLEQAAIEVLGDYTKTFHAISDNQTAQATENSAGHEPAPAPNRKPSTGLRM